MLLVGVVLAMTGVVGVGVVAGAGVELVGCVVDGVAVDVEEVAVMLGPSVVFELVTSFIEVSSDLLASLLYAQRVPLNIPNSRPPTTTMPSTVMRSAVGRLTASAALI